MTIQRPCVSFDDERRLARRRLPRLLFDYIDGGASDEITLARNVADFRSIDLRQRVMIDMSAVDPGTTVLGQNLALPVILGPVGFAGMYSRRGEIDAGRAAVGRGVPFCLSTVSICSVKEVTAATAPPWFQLYLTKDRGISRELLSRASSAGCPVLVLTVDMPAPGARYRDQRSGMARPPGALGRIDQAVDALSRPRWLWNVFVRGRPHNFGNLAGTAADPRNFADAWGWIRDNFDPSVSWDDLEFVRRHWKGPVVVKGVMERADAREAVLRGADAVVVSNHGGRQLDGVPSTLSVLPEIVEAAGGEVPVLVDGGIRSGLDVLKALCLGASACMLGRAWAFALAAGGFDGVDRMLGRMREELVLGMVLTGCTSVANAGPGMLRG